jgi:hypothetical protein
VSTLGFAVDHCGFQFRSSADIRSEPIDRGFRSNLCSAGSSDALPTKQARVDGRAATSLRAGHPKSAFGFKREEASWTRHEEATAKTQTGGAAGLTFS